MVSSLSLYTAFFGGSSTSGVLGIDPASLVNLAASRNISTALNRELDNDKVRISGLGQLKSALTAFQSAIDGLKSAATVNPATTSSSDGSVATATVTADAQLGTYDIVTSQLAAAQTVESGAYADAGTTSVGTGTLHIQLGSVSGSSFTAGPDPAIDVTITDGTLNGIAAAINAADAGVSATVVQVGGTYKLALASTDTGTTNAFEITVTDNDGNNTDNAGLSQATFNHAAGTNLTQTQTAEDASYTINGVAGTSASNTGVSAAPGVKLNLLKAGSTTITVGQDVANVQSAAQDFVDAYNTLVSAAGALSGDAGSLPEGSIAGDILDGIDRKLAKSFSGASPFTVLGEIGIEKQADGTLALDATTLQNAFNTDADAATALINAAATDFDDFADTFTRVGGTIDNAAQRLQQQVNFLDTRTTGADFAFSVLQTQAVRQYAAILALSL